MTKKILSSDVARKFFGSLYEEEQDLPTDEFDSLVTGLVTRTGNNVLVGDQALQSLLVNFALSNAQSLDQVKEISSALAGIKQAALDEVTRQFPNANLDELVVAARDAGYDVQVLGRLK